MNPAPESFRGFFLKIFSKTPNNEVNPQSWTNFGGFNMKLTFEDKKEIYNLYCQGYGYKLIALQ